MSRKKTSNKQLLFYRVNLFFVLTLVFAGAVIFSVLRLNFVKASSYKEITDSLAYKIVSQQPERGNILDANGNLLATTVLAYNVYFDLKSSQLSDSLFNADKDSLAYCLSKFTGRYSHSQYLQMFESVRESPTERSIIIGRDLTPFQLEELKTFPIFREEHPYRSGLVAERIFKRELPYGDLLKRSIGSLKEERSVEGLYGQSGLEGVYNKDLSGKSYKIKVQKIGAITKPVTSEEHLSIQRGVDLVTAIDINLQNFAHQAVKKQLLNTAATKATLVVMETETGYIKAMVNLKENEDSTVSEVQNYAAGYSMAPGSTFKVPVAVALMEDGHISGDDIINTSPGFIMLHGEPVRDYADLGNLNIEQILSKSSNVGMAKLVDQYYSDQPDELIRRLYDLGLAEKTGIDVLGEQESIIRSAKPGEDYNRFTLISISFGYGVAITPISLLTFYNAIANDGYKVHPRMVKAFERHGKTEKIFRPYEDPELICSKTTLKVIQKALLGVVEEGTAESIKTDKYKIAGKTGTARYYDPLRKEFIEKYRASFVGYFPADRPKYSMIVVFYETEGDSYTGSAVAAPVFRTVSDYIFQHDLELNAQESFPKADLTEAPYSKSGNRHDIDNVLSDLGIAFAVDRSNTSNWIRTEKDRYMINYRNMPFANDLVPNVIDLSAKDAVYLLESYGLNVRISGAGTVRYQSVTPGTPVSENMTITLELR
jgi:cell division protein FtsI (penicillin-binding protein 3)